MRRFDWRDRETWPPRGELVLFHSEPTGWVAAALTYEDGWLIANEFGDWVESFEEDEDESITILWAELPEPKVDDR